MKRLRDYDEREQSIPKNRERALASGYVTQGAFEEMQAQLKEQIKKQTTVLEQALLELKQVKLHLASLSGESIETEDTED